LASHSCTFKSFFSFSLLIIFSCQLTAQYSIPAIHPIPVLNIESAATTSKKTTNWQLLKPLNTKPFKGFGYLSFTLADTLTKQQVKSRVRIATVTSVVGYSVILAGLNAAWYADFPRSGFHFFNDNAEWLQVDKVGHMYSAYIESRASMELWRWTGIDRKKRIWIGGLSGAAYQTVIEVLDGFSAEWGWSWGDFTANILGSASLISQELAWNDQRIKLKFSFHKNDYGDPALNKRANELYGNTLGQRFIKDYNAQTYWASANLQAFFPKSNLPSWLSMAIGYGADGMFGARENIATNKDGNVTFDRRDIKRYRQWYLAPDIDFTKIKTRKKGVKYLFVVLSAFKIPTPSLEFSNGKFKVHALHF
jgi:uncharacterized protein YfiM (DUF2279 family)